MSLTRKRSRSRSNSNSRSTRKRSRLIPESKSKSKSESKSKSKSKIIKRFPSKRYSKVMSIDTRSRDWRNRIRPKKISIQPEPIQPEPIKTEPIRTVRKSTTKIKLKKIRIVSAHALSKKRLTYNTMIIMLKKMATMLISGRSMKDIMDILSKTIGGKYRALLSRGNPDKECGAAASLATNRGEKKCQAINYKTSIFRQNQSQQPDQSKYNKSIQYNAELPFAWIKEDIIEDNKPKKKMMKQAFVPTGKGGCGDCWLCGQPVIFYYNSELVTGCGECEHIGAISASFLTGMLSSAGLYEQVYNYGSSHVHCNQRKGQSLSVTFDPLSSKWITYEQGINKIIGEIVNKDIHESEYDLEFIKSFENMKEINMKERMKKRIKEVSEKWCESTNAILASYGRDNQKIADRLCKIMLLTIEPIKEKLITSMGNLEEIDTDGMDVVGGRQALALDNAVLMDDKYILNDDKMITMNKEKLLKPHNINNEEVETDSEWLNKMFKMNPNMMKELLTNLIASIDKTLEKLYEEDDIKEINKLLMNDNNDLT